MVILLNPHAARGKEQEASSFFPPLVRFCLTRLPEHGPELQRKHTAHAHSLVSAVPLLFGWLVRPNFRVKGLRSSNSHDICCGPQTRAAAGFWRALSVLLVAGTAVLPRGACLCSMTSALENYINRILKLAAAGVSRGRGEAAARGSVGGWEARPRRDPGGGRGDEDPGMTQSSPAAPRACQLLRAQGSFPFCLQKPNKNPV
ncbi:hypothetical protein H8959_007656 [Pygathrix nigripes]